MPGEFDIPDTSLDNFDVGGVVNDLAGELFGGSGLEADPDVSPAAPPAPNSGTATPAPPPPTTPPTAPEPWRAMPKAWKKEMEPHWNALTPEHMQYIHAREGDVSRGFQQYQSAHENWNKVIAPYQDLLSQHPDVEPTALLSNLLQSHLTLAQGSPEQKQVIARQLLSAYGIDLGQAPEQVDAIAKLQQRLDAYEQRDAKAKQDAVLKEVTTFMEDPANKHAKAVWKHMQALLRGGVPSLKEAYDQACWLDPTVRAEVLKAQQDAAAAEVARVNALNKKTPDSPSNSAPRKAKTWEDGVDETVARLTNPGPKH